MDVQVGCQLYEDSPQELRSRLWTALLEHPELVTEYQVGRWHFFLCSTCVWQGTCYPRSPHIVQRAHVRRLYMPSEFESNDCGRLLGRLCSALKQH